jgi:hypothetical protein
VDSHGVSRAPCYSGTPLNVYFGFRVRDFHPLWSDFPDSFPNLFQLKAPATPGRSLVWAVPISLAATHGINVFLFSCRYLDVSVPYVRSILAIHSPGSNARSLHCVSAFRDLRINTCLPVPRSISQATTSFIASRCQGIHHTPLVA